jgi:transcriptional regulator with XRE-family HTH domain
MFLVIEMNRLRKLRKAKNFTQIKIQMMTRIDQSDYSKLENGQRNLTFEQCKSLALDTSMDYLAGITDNPNAYERSRDLPR